MATIDASHPSTATTLENDKSSMESPLTPTIVKQPEAYESPSSPSHSSDPNHSDEDDDEKRDLPPQDMEEAKKVQSTGGDSIYPEGKQVVVIMLALFSAMFLVALDRTIIATAIPKITDEFHSLDDVGWYGSAFLLTASCFQLLIGRIYTFYTPKYVFLIIITIFEIGSALCGAAPNSIAFIIGRAIAGIGSAGVTSGVIIIMVSTVPLHKRPVFQGMFGAVFGVASVVGPLLGGAFTTDVSWRWCFYINLPIGAVAILIIIIFLKPTEPTRKGLTIYQQLSQLDLLGELFLLPCIICLLLALQWGGSTYSWSDGRIIALFVLFGVLLIAFILVQIFMQQTATIPLRLLHNRSIIGAMWFTFCLASGMMLIVYYLPIWFQAIEGVSAVESGIRTIPLVLSLVVGAIVGGQVVGRIGYYTPFVYLSGIIMPIGAGLLTTLKLNSSEGIWIGFQILYGLGIGFGMQQGGMAAQTVLDKRDVPIGVSLVFFTQMLGGAIFISVGQNVLDSNLIKGIVGTVKGIDATTIVSTGATDLRNLTHSAAELHEILLVYNSALRQTFIVATAMSALAILGGLLIEWRSVKGQQGPSAKSSKQSDDTEATAGKA